MEKLSKGLQKAIFDRIDRLRKSEHIPKVNSNILFLTNKSEDALNKTLNDFCHHQYQVPIKVEASLIKNILK